jgi:hypothetical protein
VRGSGSIGRFLMVNFLMSRLSDRASGRERGFR